MNYLKLFLLINFFAFTFGQQGTAEKYFEQKLDHSAAESTTWKQRYLENNEHFKPGGPVFIAYGGPYYAPITPEFLKESTMAQYAKQEGAHLVLLEARYYGKSRPTGDLSTENLHKYATDDNTVADSAAFLKWYKSQPEFKDSKVVAFGHVYLGSRLVQNMRKESGLIDIGVLSSVPVESRFEIPEYTKQEMEILRGINSECATTVTAAISCLDDILHGGTCEGHALDDLKATFNLCDDVDPSNLLDNAALMGEIIKLVGYVVLLDNPAASYNVHKMCDALGDTSNGLTHMDKLATEIKKVLQVNKKQCLEFRFTEIEKRVEVIEWDTPEVTSGVRTLTFLKCKYSPIIRTPEGLGLSEERLDSYRNYYLEMCKRAFNMSPEDVRNGAEATDKKYGQRMIPNKCALFITEQGDLLKTLEITTQEEAGKCNAVVLSKAGGVLADNVVVQEENGDEDVKSLKEAESKVGKIINHWLKTGDCCSSPL